ncbi:MAG: nucleotide pyrophosphohydrolase, partial [Planctomycetota bacterium]
MPDDPAPNENATGTPLASGSGTPVASLSGTPLASRGDDATTVAELRKLIADFVDERDWRQYHSPKNISMALAIEAAELMEHFQWLDQQASRLVV